MQRFVESRRWWWWEWLVLFELECVLGAIWEAWFVCVWIGCYQRYLRNGLWLFLKLRDAISLGQSSWFARGWWLLVCLRVFEKLRPYLEVKDWGWHAFRCLWDMFVGYWLLFHILLCALVYCFEWLCLWRWLYSLRFQYLRLFVWRIEQILFFAFFF